MDALRVELSKLLAGGQAFETFDQIIGSFKPGEVGVVPAGAEHSAWQIVEHMQMSLRDLLDFIQNENGTYQEKKWPEEYWAKNAEPQPGQWDKSVAQYRDGVKELVALVNEHERDFYTPFPWGEGQNFLREVLVAAEHAAYHLGELAELQRWLRATKDGGNTR